MNERRFSVSRRALARYCGIGATVGVAGCLWGGDDSDDSDESDDGDDESDDSPGNGDAETLPLTQRFELAGDGSSGFREWLIPDNPVVFQNGTKLLFQHNDYEAAVAAGWSGMSQERQNLASSFGTEVESHDGAIIIGAPGDGSQPRHIYLGEFDQEGVVQFLKNEGWETHKEYDGYTVIQRDDISVAIGSDAMLVTPLYEEYIDAKNGRHERLGEVDESVGTILDLLPDGIQISVSRDPERTGVDVTGTAIMEVDSDGTFQRKVRAFVFKNESDASVDAAREFVSMAEDGPLTSEHHEHVVMLEYVPE